MSESAGVYQTKNINRLEEIFWQGCKAEQTNHLGVELEHFIVDSATKKALPYAGEKSLNTILQCLLLEYQDAERVYDTEQEEKNGTKRQLLGFTAEEFALSLEPAAQLEISMQPTDAIRKIEQIYDAFRCKLDAVLEQMGAECVTQGYHPQACADELQLIPKERYVVMDAYFEQFGHGGREMMRATASTQISVDYRSESDFRKKYQTAYVLTPIIKYLTDHTPVYEGKPNNLRLRRSQIWNRVDKARTGIVPGVLAKDFSFHDYAEYLWHLPLVYCPEKYLPEGFADRFVLQTEGKEKEQIQGKKISAVGSLTPAQIWDSEVISEEAAWHIMSMAFPDVRLKNYVEIRGADALCKEKMLAYAALIKGTLYQPEVLDAVAQAVQSGSLTETDIKEAEECVQADGRQAVVYGQPLGSLCDRLLDTAQKALPEEEQGYLDCLRSLQQKLRTV